MNKSFFAIMVFAVLCFSQTKPEGNRYDIIPAKLTHTTQNGTFLEYNTMYLVDHKTGQVWYHISVVNEGKAEDIWMPIENYQLGQIKPKK